MQHFLLQFTCFLKRKWIWQKINNVFSNSVFRLNNEILITLHLYILFLKTQYTNILFNQVPWNSSLEKVKLHCVKVIGPDSTSNSFMSTSGSRVQMWLFHTRHLADVYGSFTDQEMGRQLAGKSRLLLSFSFWYYYVHVTNTWCFEITCIFWIYRRFKFPVKKSFQLVKVFLQDEYELLFWILKNIKIKIKNFWKKIIFLSFIKYDTNKHWAFPLVWILTCSICFVFPMMTSL